MKFLLRWSGRFLALGLVILVLASPRFAPADPTERWQDRALWLFANDSTLRQVSLACAIGIFLTAQLFFAKPRKPLPPLPPKEPPTEPDVPPPPPRREG